MQLKQKKSQLTSNTLKNHVEGLKLFWGSFFLIWLSAVSCQKNFGNRLAIRPFSGEFFNNIFKHVIINAIYCSRLSLIRNGNSLVYQMEVYCIYRTCQVRFHRIESTRINLAEQIAAFRFRERNVLSGKRNIF